MSTTATSLAPRSDFPVLEEFVYLNNASIGLAPEPVRATAKALDEQIGGRGTIGFDDEVEKLALDEPRRGVARLFGVTERDVAVTTNATEALNQIAWWLRPGEGENVVSFDIEFPSVTYPWLRLAEDSGVDVRLAPVLDDPGAISLELLAERVDERTKAICVSHVQYATGHRLDPRALSELAHAHDALLVLDVSQSAGVVPMELEAWDVDVVVSTGYKWICGPPGAGICYVRPELHEEFRPPFLGWRSTPDPPAFDATRIPLAEGVRRMEYSTPAYGSVVGLGAACEYLLDLGIERVLEHDQRLAALLMDGLEERGATVLTPRADEQRAGIVIARFPGRSGNDVFSKLDEARVIVSPRLGAVRFSHHVYNDESDVMRALEAIDGILAAPARGE
jgi:cysteine desulfurase/selenocysteine lyase